MKNLNLRTILIIVILISTSSIIFNDLISQIIISFITLFLLILKKNNINKTAKKLKNIGKIVLSLFLFQLLFRRSGTPLITFWIIKITDNGLIYAFTSTLRIFIIIIIASLLFDYPFKEYLNAFAAWKLPYEFSFLISGAIYFISNFSLELKNTMEALHSRGISITKIPLFKRLEVFSTLIFPIIAKALNDIQYKAISLDLRGFRLYKCRTSLYENKLSKKDIIIQILSFFLFFIFILIKKIF